MNTLTISMCNLLFIGFVALHAMHEDPFAGTLISPREQTADTHAHVAPKAKKPEVVKPVAIVHKPVVHIVHHDVRHVHFTGKWPFNDQYKISKNNHLLSIQKQAVKSPEDFKKSLATIIAGNDTYFNQNSFVKAMGSFFKDTKKTIKACDHAHYLAKANSHDTRKVLSTIGSTVAGIATTTLLGLTLWHHSLDLAKVAAVGGAFTLLGLLSSSYNKDRKAFYLNLAHNKADLHKHIANKLSKLKQSNKYFKTLMF